MENEILIPGHMSKEDRLAMLQDYSDHILKDVPYQKLLTPEMVDAKRESHSDNAIELADLEAELDEKKGEYKKKMDPLRANIKQLLQEIRTKQENKRGNLYEIANHHTGFMEIYDSEGEWISARKLRPDERQGNLYNNK